MHVLSGCFLVVALMLLCFLSLHCLVVSVLFQVFLVVLFPVCRLVGTVLGGHLFVLSDAQCCFSYVC